MAEHFGQDACLCLLFVLVISLGQHLFWLAKHANSWRVQLLIYAISLRSDLIFTSITLERFVTDHLFDVRVHSPNEFTTNLPFCGFLYVMLLTEIICLYTWDVVELRVRERTMGPTCYVLGHTLIINDRGV